MEKPKVCPTCNGWGQTRQTKTVIGVRKDGSPYTVRKGSGCPKCLGRGRLE